MKTPSPMTTEERIEELEGQFDSIDDEALETDELLLYVVACELRALRLMLRDEIREAAWPLKQWAELNYAPIVPRPESMKAPHE